MKAIPAAMLSRDHFDRLSDFELGAVCAHVWADVYTSDGEPAEMLVPGCRPEDGDDHLRLTLPTLRSLAADARDFATANAAELARYRDANRLDDEECGHLFALSRSGHGAGFFDYPGGGKLQAASRPYGDASLMLCVDGRIRF